MNVSPEQMQETMRIWHELTLDMFKKWDSDQDAKVGKILAALCLRNRGYRPDIDRIIDTLEDKEWNPQSSGDMTPTPKN